MIGQSDYSRKLWRWLERWGFVDDPFALYQAEEEHRHLPKFFVDRPYLHEILGDPSRPQPAFLFAERGDGKTATREMVAYECTHAGFRRRALAVEYYDFAPLLNQVQAVGQLTLRNHIKAIGRNVIKALAEDIPAVYYDLLGETEQSLLLGFVTHFGDPISQLKLRQIIKCEPVQLDWDILSSLETLETVAALIVQLGQAPDARYQALYILIDRIDETSAGRNAAISLLAPLLSEGTILQAANVAWKFFLPLEIIEQLQTMPAWRPDRLSIQKVSWDEKALKEVIEQRLRYYSEGRVERFEDLCESRIKTSSVERLIRASNGSPRALLRLCRAMIHLHIERSETALLNRDDLFETLTDIGHQLDLERNPTLLRQNVPSQLIPSEPPNTGMYLDSGGHVWVDGALLSPPLSDLEFRLLKTLYQYSPEIVSHQSLIEAVWPSVSWMNSQEAHDEQNLRKLINRIRDQLPGEKSRFIKNARGRGYWLATNKS